MLEDIPNELKLLCQWCVWQYEDIGARKPTKVPYDPKNLKGRFSVNEPDTWATFEQACSIVGKYDGIGFILSKDDPYAFIDLDDCTTLIDGNPNPNHAADQARQLKIFQEFDSYSEFSPSGKGIHIIIKGQVPQGRRRSFIEVYSSQRYATFTGNVYSSKPIANRQELLNQLWEQMGSGVAATYMYLGDSVERSDDTNVYNIAYGAINGEKFKDLYDGQWIQHYPSQSEADFALIDMLSFYTQNTEQIVRIFRASALGKRDKAKRDDYIKRMISRSFDKMLPPIDFDGFKIALDNKIAGDNFAGVAHNLNVAYPVKEKINDKKLHALDDSRSSTRNTGNSIPVTTATVAPQPKLIEARYKVPPGLMGELAQFIYLAAPRPVPEIALAGAIGLMSGIAGRAYNISGTGLNNYVLLLAKTGVGKEGISSGIDKLINAVVMQVPTARNFIGPSEIASAAAMNKYIAKSSQSFVSILGEFGLRLQQISNPLGNDHGVKKMLLDLYNKSGFGQYLGASIWADSQKNIGPIAAPAFSIVGESTPERFYNILNEDMITEGLLPRFLIIEYDGQRMDLNENAMNLAPSFALIDRFAGFLATVEQIMHAKRVINIGSTDLAAEMLRKFDKECTVLINKSSDEARRQLWSRAHMKVLKLAGLISVGINMIDPLVVPEHVEWAIDMVKADIEALSVRFEKGEIGAKTEENKQMQDINKIIKEYFASPKEQILSYLKLDKKAEAIYNARLISYSYLQKRLVAMASYRTDRLGATQALKRSIQILIDSDKLREVARGEMTFKFGSTQRAFVVSDLGIMD